MAAPEMIVIATPAIDTLQHRIDPIVARADAMRIEDQETYEAAASFLTSCKAMEKEIRETLEPTIRKAHEAHRAATALRAKLLAPIEQAESAIKRKIGTYVEEQRRLADEQRRRQEAEARRIEEERRLREAEELAARGDDQAAEEVLAEPIALPSIPVAEKPVAKGISTGWTYGARVVDAAALIRAAAEGRIPAGLVIPNEKAIAALARSLKEGFELPGCELVKTPAVSARAV